MSVEYLVPVNAYFSLIFTMSSATDIANAVTMFAPSLSK